MSSEVTSTSQDVTSPVMREFRYRIDETREANGGYQVVIGFDNGYQVSVICNEISYGHRAGLFEIAAMLNGDLVRDALDGETVVGWLTGEQVDAWLDRVNTWTRDQIVTPEITGKP